MKTSALFVAALAAPVLSETIHGVVIYSRHGDRTSKVYKGYQVTNLGAQQVYSSGSFYRSRYVEAGAPHKIFDISSDVYKPAQLWASAPDQSVLLQTATNFLQGLYPPLEELNSALATETLTNGTETVDPLGGYQFVQIHGEDEKDSDTIWLKGSDLCPAYSNASDTYEESTEYISLLESTATFYEQFNEPLNGVLPPSKISYANAYDVFDLLNTASIHNSSDIVTPEQLAQLRYYANSWELGRNYNRTMDDRSLGGQTLGGAFLKQLNETVASHGKLKFSLMTGSYNTFLAFFGLANLTTISTTNNFTGLPNYASSISFELFSTENTTAFPSEADLNVRFLFRNGTSDDDALTAYPLFGQDRIDLPYAEFREMMETRSIMSTEKWCNACQTTKSFCLAYASEPETTGGGLEESTSNKGHGGMSLAVAGVVGALVTLGVVALIGAAFWLVKRRSAKKPVLERKLSSEGSASV